MLDRTQTTSTVHRLLLERWPNRFHDVELDDDLSLGEYGLGLDSIDIVEFLLHCEEHFGGPGTEQLLTGGPVTLGRVIEHFVAA